MEITPEREARMELPDTLPIWVDGAWRARAAPAFTADDQGALYGLGAFETIWIKGQRPVALRRHLARLEGALARLAIPADLAPLGAALRALAARLDPAGEAAGRLVVSAGPPGGPSVRVAQVRALPPTLAARRAGVEAAAVTGLARILPEVKSLAWLPSILAQRAVPPGVEPCFVDASGCVTEGATCNLFVRRAGRWWTPPAEGALPGVARGVVLALAAASGVAIDEGPVPVEWLAEAEEAFVSNALLPVAPLRVFAGRALPPPSALQRTWAAGYLDCADAR